jgi:hypothetical protein
MSSKINLSSGLLDKALLKAYSNDTYIKLFRDEPNKPEKEIISLDEEKTRTEIEKLKIENHKLKLDNDDKEQDRKLKKHFAYWSIGVLIVQLLIMNFVFYMVGIEKLKFDNYSLHLYMAGTLAEVFGIVFIITKYLFPKR